MPLLLIEFDSNGHLEKVYVLGQTRPIRQLTSGLSVGDFSFCFKLYMYIPFILKLWMCIENEPILRGRIGCSFLGGSDVSLF